MPQMLQMFRMLPFESHDIPPPPESFRGWRGFDMFTMIWRPISVAQRAHKEGADGGPSEGIVNHTVNHTGQRCTGTHTTSSLEKAHAAVGRWYALLCQTKKECVGWWPRSSPAHGVYSCRTAASLLPTLCTCPVSCGSLLWRCPYLMQRRTCHPVLARPYRGWRPRHPFCLRTRRNRTHASCPSRDPL